MDRPVNEQHFAEALFAEARDGDVFFLLELEKSKKFVRKVPLTKDNYKEILQNMQIIPNHHYFITANSYLSGTSHTGDAGSCRWRSAGKRGWARSDRLPPDR